jgi:hypothetical protein
VNVKFNGGNGGQPALASSDSNGRPMQAHRKTPFRTIDATDILVPEPPRRGRMVPDARHSHAVEDAVFEVVSRQTPRQELNDNPPPSRVKANAPVILPVTARLVFSAVAIIERQLLKLSAPVFSTVLVGAFFAVFWLLGGFAVLNSARTLPAITAPFTVSRVSITSEDANGMKVLVISGTLTNPASATHETPLLAVMSRDRRTTFGTIVLPLEKIGPDTSLRFAGRFKLAGGKLADIVIIPQRR